jgi:hypothetical protein
MSDVLKFATRFMVVLLLVSTVMRLYILSTGEQWSCRLPWSILTISVG